MDFSYYNISRAAGGGTVTLDLSEDGCPSSGERSTAHLMWTHQQGYIADDWRPVAATA
jgi:hypothetical protein